MASVLVGRRAFLALGAGFALTGCATSIDNASIPVIRSVRVSGTINLWVRNICPYVQQHLIEDLGPRYQPGARGGASLVVELTGIDMPSDSDGGGISMDSTDVLEGRISLLSAGGGAIKSFPLLASTASIDAASEIQEPTPRRYDWLASTYAHWVIEKLA